MELVKLGDICAVKGGYAFKSENFSQEGIPVIRIGDIQNKRVDVMNAVCIDDDIKKYEDYRIYRGDVLIALSGATTGKFGVFNYESPALLNQRLAKLQPNKRVKQEYLYCYMNLLQSIILDSAKGAAQPNISTKEIAEFVIPLFSIRIQEKIVQILNTAQSLIDKRKEQIEACDVLITSRFVEMFGDPISNHNSWEYRPIGAVVNSITAGWSANGEARLKKLNEKAVLKVSAVTQGFFKPDEYKVINGDEPIKKYVFPQKGDLIFSRANTREMVGATAIIEHDYPDLLLPDKLWKILFENIVNVYYMKFILSTPAIRAEFSAQSTGTSGSMYNVSMDKFKGISIPIPPLDLQNQFATFVQQVDKLKFDLRKSLSEMEDNFNVLMQKAFKGELFCED